MVSGWMLFIIISLVSQARPPGVFISNTTARACSFCARSRMRFMKPKLCLLVRASSPTGMRTTLSRKDSSAAARNGAPANKARKASNRRWMCFMVKCYHGGSFFSMGKCILPAMMAALEMAASGNRVRVRF